MFFAVYAALYCFHLFHNFEKNFKDSWYKFRKVVPTHFIDFQLHANVILNLSMKFSSPPALKSVNKIAISRL